MVFPRFIGISEKMAKKRNTAGLRKHLKLTMVLADLEPFVRAIAICGSQYKTGETKKRGWDTYKYIHEETKEEIGWDFDYGGMGFDKWFNEPKNRTHPFEHVPDGKTWREIQRAKWKKSPYYYEYEYEVHTSLFAEKMEDMDCKKCYWFLFRKGLINEEKHEEWKAMGKLHPRFAKWERWSDIK